MTSLRTTHDLCLMVLKLYVGRVYTLQDIANFICGPFGLKLPIHALLGEFLGYK